MDEDGIELASYSRERHRADGGSLSGAFIDLFAEQGTAACVLLRGTDGFGAGQARGGRSLTLADDAPLTVAAVDTRGTSRRCSARPCGLPGPGCSPWGG